MGPLLRIATAGSVDDGKSTLIGRLMYDTKTIFTDQLAALERASSERGEAAPNLALLTDGLRMEREQGITIDVAYRYFATPRRTFIIADTPGHVQYTRNMVTGASTADLALILIDARKGVLEQSRRHAFIASLLGIPHLVVCVNKMDLVDWSKERFDEVREEFRRFSLKLDVQDLSFIPISALHGDNVVGRSAESAWYEGSSLLHHLEEVHVGSDQNLVDARLPVQYVVRPHQDFRGYAGTMAGGVLRPGDEVAVLPSGCTSRIARIWGPGGVPVQDAFPPQTVTVELDDHIDVGRGDLICRPNNRPHVGQDLDATVCWLSDRSTLTPGATYLVKHTSQLVRTSVEHLNYRLDVNTLHRDESAGSLTFNEIGRIRLRTQEPLHYDPYKRNRGTGSFVLVDEVTNNTVGAGMIIGPAAQQPADVVWHAPAVSRDQRATRGCTVWITGLSGAGKSSVAAELERRLVAAGRPAYLLDGDNLRHDLNSDLGFGRADRAENVRRTGAVAKLFADSGAVAIVSLVSPYRQDRDAVRAAHAAAGIDFVEIFLDTPLAVCESRDPKGLYARARAGAIRGFTGIDDAYEAPLDPDLVLRPSDGDPAALASAVLARLDR
ncbi:adenylyl-sulfate kinase [Pseudonocardia sp. TRM90224]|uniref:adenylyl-sulfate kinase n=1 Tax=Pseudonocardia sp. TRM90224 TaxID=2812678 RepID=UPI001E65BA87|nr:adenylyl-sulfate kinase [Pseudonocardia sp. TRM90224]